ncbi:MAG: hypothetical protein MJY72_00650 [Bacteroidales bacterium]|nr:hypothetical protein [Bacteroidales bacterium]
MAIRVLSVKDYATKLKATIQATGKLGFTDDTAKALSLTPDRYVKIAYDDECDTFYLVVVDDKDPDAFKVCSAGDYYYLPTSSLFRAMGLDYQAYSIIFDMARDNSLDQELGGAVYKMFKRSTERRKNKM